jgi:uncharacterized delta-60 repeat protein
MTKISLLRKILVLIVLLPVLFSSKPAQAAQGGPAVIWQQTWGGNNYEQASGLAVDSGGNIYSTGVTTTYGLGIGDVFLLKYNGNGTLLWQRTWGGVGNDVGTGVAVNSSGDVYVTGYTNSSGAGGFDAILLKFNSAGSLVWQRSWGGRGNDYGYGIALDARGGVYVSGETTSLGAGGSDAFVLKTDASGNLLWARTWGGNGDDSGRSIATDSLGSIYVAGYTQSFGAGYPSAFLLKLNSTGDLLWQRIWIGSNCARAYGVAVDSSDNVYSTGTDPCIGAYSAGLLSKYNSSGGLLWLNSWGVTSIEEGRAVAVSQDGGVYVTGLTKNLGSPAPDVSLLKYIASGAIVYQRASDGIGLKVGYAVATDPLGNPVVAGTVGASSYAISDISLPYQSIAASVSSSGNSTLGIPLFILSNPSGTVGIPSGSQTYGGGQDAFIFKYASISLTVTFNVYGAGYGGWIDLLGQSYYNGQTADYQNGTYAIATACVVQPLIYGVSSQQYYCSAPLVYNWTTTGGVSVSDPKKNPTNVTVTGPGTLTAYLKIVGSISPNTILLTTIGITAAVLISKKRKKSSSDGRSQFPAHQTLLQ